MAHLDANWTCVVIENLLSRLALTINGYGKISSDLIGKIDTIKAEELAVAQKSGMNEIQPDRRATQKVFDWPLYICTMPQDDVDVVPYKVGITWKIF